VAVQRGGEKRSKLAFRYPKEKWNRNCVEPTARLGEKETWQMITACFYGQSHGLFLPVFPNSS